MACHEIITCLSVHIKLTISYDNNIKDTYNIAQVNEFISEFTHSSLIC